MNFKDILKLLKAIYAIILPFFASCCFIMYWHAELIVDKVHYGIFMVVFLILMLDNTNSNNKSNKAATN